MIVKVQIAKFIYDDIDGVNKFLQELPDGRYVGIHVNKAYIYVEYVAQIDDVKKLKL